MRGTAGQISIVAEGIAVSLRGKPETGVRMVLDGARRRVVVARSPRRKRRQRQQGAAAGCNATLRTDATSGAYKVVQQAQDLSKT
jgi:hypothetical protein